MEYPSGSEYQKSVQNCHICVLDPLLRDGQPQKKSNYGLLVYSGGYTRVFPVDVNQKMYALRCWTNSVENVEYRYQEIKTYLEKYQLSCFVLFDYIAEGILVNGLKYPILRMEWAEGPNLKTFIQNNLYSSDILEKAADNFLQTVQLLHQNNIAHGDLQHENIIVQGQKDDIQMILIDYDSLYIPAFQGMKDEIAGKPSFQHPARIKNEQSSEATDYIDYFSELVIYLTILVFAEQPSLWDQFNINALEDFFFTDQDFIYPDQSPIFEIFDKMSARIQYLAAALRNYCHQSSITQFIPLEMLVNNTQAQIKSQTNTSTPSIENIVTDIAEFSKAIPNKTPHEIKKVKVDQLIQNIKNLPPPKKTVKKPTRKGIDQLVNNIKSTT
jgi:serine/threonine protein kinase